MSNISQYLRGKQSAAFTTSGTWSVPPSVNLLWIFGVGGGGGSGGGPSTSFLTNSQGGTGGQSGLFLIPGLILPSSLAITIGAGGAAGSGGVHNGSTTVYGTNGSPGGNTTVNFASGYSGLVFQGGYGGYGNSSSIPSIMLPADNQLLTGSSGTFSLGNCGSIYSPTVIFVNTGGVSLLGGASPTAHAAGGTGYGWGGNGVASSGSYTVNGSAGNVGGPGVVFLIWE